MEKSIQIEKQELIERIEQTNDAKVLEKLRKILFTRREDRAVVPCCPSAISVQELRDILEQNELSKDGITQDVFIEQAMQWR